MKRRNLVGLIVMIIASALTTTVTAQSITLESCVNGAVYTVDAEPGTAGIQGTDYILGSYLAGGEGLGHGFKGSLGFHLGHFCGATEESCYVSEPLTLGKAGALADVDHNWLQGFTRPIVVDVLEVNKDDRAIVFNSTDHTGGGNCGTTPAKLLWNKVVEGIEFTVYGTNDTDDAKAAAATSGVFSQNASETGSVPEAGVGSSFEQAELEYVFEDGWADFSATDEGDDYASVWLFPSGTKYRYIAVYSNHTDPFIDDGFRSSENELDAIGVFIGKPGVQVAEHSCLGGFLPPFDSPLDIKKKSKRTIPVKCELLDVDGNLMTDQDIVAPPVVTVTLEDGTVYGNTPQDDEDLLPNGSANTDNVARFSPDDGFWIYNLSTRLFSSKGRYTVNFVSGDALEYTINGTATQQFTRLP